jgi:uncharacterized protein YjbI with pentapeptide repeats
MKITIRSRWTDAVLFECDAPEGLESGLHMRHTLEKAVQSGANLYGADLTGADLTGADLTGASLYGANLTGANLTGADLTGADLTGADLTGASLSGAKWCDGITINRQPLQISGLHWFVHILDQHMQIGCELHALSEWATFDDARIVAMDGRDALRFWRANKDALLALAKADGRGVEVKETA